MANHDVLDLGRMRVLREIGLRGSIAGAARSLGLTASAVSQQLALLERETRAALVDRTPQGVVLTGAGQALAERTGQVLEVLARAQADLDRSVGSLAGTVRIAAVASAGATVVSSAVSALRARHRGIEVSVVAAEPAAGIDLLLARDVDLAVVDEYDQVPLALPDYVSAVELCREPLVAVLPAPGRRRPRLADLAGQDWVMPPEGAACGQAVRAACRAAGFEPRVTWETDDMLLLATAVAAGHGVAVLPLQSVAPNVPGVRTARIAGLDLHRTLRAVARASAWNRPVVGAVLDQMRRAGRRLPGGRATRGGP
ncbi:MAG: LysR family transcriptional regulator [Jatrophihabitans sp.]|nr:MAG: LysR family transcriptional regulator [Jatrophihabitans sp.]